MMKDRMSESLGHMSRAWLIQAASLGLSEQAQALASERMHKDLKENKQAVQSLE